MPDKGDKWVDAIEAVLEWPLIAISMLSTNPMPVVLAVGGVAVILGTPTANDEATTWLKLYLATGAALIVLDYSTGAGGRQGDKPPQK